MKPIPPKSIDEYIALYPAEIQEKLQMVRIAIKETAPNAQEAMAYGIPTFKLHGNLVHFGAGKNHLGFYPAPSGIAKFKEEISKYKWAKGSVQFPFNQEIPLDLIKRITQFSVEENEQLAKEK